MTFWLALAVALLAFLLAGFALGHRHARYRATKARGGMLPLRPWQVPEDRWNFPPAPKLFDQEREGTAEYWPRASLGNPLIPDPVNVTVIERELGPEAAAVAATMNETVRALDPHSRRVQ